MKRVLVLGGSGLVGGALVRRLSRDGERVAFTFRSNEAAAHAIVEERPDVTAIHADLSILSDIARAVDRAAEVLGGIDALVHCAAVAHAPGKTTLATVDEAAWDAIFDVNLKSAYFAVRCAIAHMHKSADVVLVGAVEGVKRLPAPAPYAASKAALVGLTVALAKELGPRGVRVNLVAPGLVDGNGLTRDIAPALRADYLKHAGMRRLGTAGEIAATLAWLCTENTYVTGETIVVDGAL